LKKTSHDYVNENKKLTKNKNSFKYSNKNTIPKMNLHSIKQKAEKQRYTATENSSSYSINQ
jgi:hypothetical protein